MKQKQTFAVVVGNRGFFPAHLVKTGYEHIKAVLEGAGYGTVMLSFDDTKFGSVESHEDAKKCAALFKEKKDEISGVIVTLPNFGDERAVANTLRWSGLDVPVLVQAEPDAAAKMTPKDRRDSFCGKLSVCNVLRQYGIPYSLTTYHTEGVRSEEFKTDLETFAGMCRVVKAMTGVRFGAIGARTAPFYTVRYSEKILEAAGITVETIDLSEVLAAANGIKPSDKEFKDRLKALKGYAECPGVTQEGFERMARFAVTVDRWMTANDLAGTAIQCWTAIEELYGIVPCQVMSMMSNAGSSSACEVDIGGTIAMHALRAASGKPSALVDWNNNYGDDPDKCVVFHCSNLPKDVLTCPRVSFQAIIAETVGEKNAYGSVQGRIRPGAATFARVSTDDTRGIIRSYVGEGEFTDDPLETFGGYGVLEVPALQLLMQYICEEGFEHHCAISLSSVADAVTEAFDKYLGWDVYRHC
jgi:L-fucose isomerase-like protein